MITTSPLSFRYANRPTMHYPSLALSAGEPMLIIGKSGCGKTTLLHLLAGLLRPSEGQIILNGKDITTLKDKALDHFRGQHIGLIFQRSHFVQSLSVADNIRLAPYLAGKKINSDRLHKLAANLGIEKLLHQLPARLSQGEQQRVSIARAIIHQPDLVLADEPTSSLDDENTEAVARLLLERVTENGAALIIVTHDHRLKSLIQKQMTLA